MKSKIYLFLLFFISAINSIYAQTTDTIKVLFIGNSFTSVNDLPLTFKQLALGANKPVVVSSYLPGGASVGDISMGTSAHMNNPIVYNLIKSNNWNYLVLQDNHGRFVDNYGVFPASSLVIQGHKQIRDSLLFYHPCAKMLWFAGWGPKAGYLPYASTGVGLINKIYNNYRYLLDTAKQVIAPIGPAWERIITNYPGINLWDVDDVHPGLNGTSLAADVIYSTIFKTSPIKSSFTPMGITLGLDSLLKNTGFQTVMDSLNVTGLNTITPSISQIGNNLSVPSFTNCNWFLNGVLVASHTGTFNVTVIGNYTAIVYDATSCEFRTLEYNVTVVGLPENKDLSNICVSVFPNPTSEKVNIKTINTLAKIQLVNNLGQVILTIPFPKNNEVVDLTDISRGIYFFKLTDLNSKIKFEKIIIE